MTFFKNISGAFASDASADRGSTVETVLLIAGFAVIAILVVSWIGGAIAGQAANTAACIASGSTTTCASDTYGVSNTVSSNINAQKGGRF